MPCCYADACRRAEYRICSHLRSPTPSLPLTHVPTRHEHAKGLPNVISDVRLVFAHGRVIERPTLSSQDLLCARGRGRGRGAGTEGTGACEMGTGTTRQMPSGAEEGVDAQHV